MLLSHRNGRALPTHLHGGACLGHLRTDGTGRMAGTRPAMTAGEERAANTIGGNCPGTAA
jgi:hypothetical protein